MVAVKLGGRWERDSIHRPMVQSWSIDERVWGFSLQWGDRYGDPVWSIDIDGVRVPAWLDRWLLQHTS